MTATLKLPRHQPIAKSMPAIRPETERALRDIAFVLKLTQRVSEEIRSSKTNPRLR